MASHWKEIPGYPFYYVNKNGQIISKKKHKNNKNGDSIPMKPWEDKKGYLVVSLRDKENKKHNLFVHRAVALAFIDNPNSYPAINHIDRNVKNNSVSNLEWCTTQQNNSYTFTTGKGMKGCRTILYVKDVKIGEFQSISEAAKYAVANYGKNYNHLCNFLKQDEITIQRLDKPVSTFYLYQEKTLIKEFRYAKDAFVYVKEHYKRTLSYKKMFSTTARIVLIKDNEISPEEFWKGKSIKRYNPTIYYWDLYYMDKYIKRFLGRKDAVKYAKNKYPNISAEALQDKHFSHGAKIIKKAMKEKQ